MVAITGFPITSTLQGLGCYPGEDNQFIGMLGMHGTFEANNAMHDCDLLINIGARFDDRITGKIDEFSPKSKKIHIDIDPSSINKNVKVDLPIVGDVARVLKALIKTFKRKHPNFERSNKQKISKWWNQIGKWKEKNSLNFIIQKGTELGVQKFIPILSERTIVRKINLERVKKIIVESSEQSNRISIPEINKPESLKNFLSGFPKNGCLIFCDINSNQKNLKNILEKKIEGPTCILIGPEGDFSEKERKQIIDLNQTCSISLAKNILKAETAALSAIAIVNYHLNLS